jgi:hypothetical protein
LKAIGDLILCTSCVVHLFKAIGDLNF